MPIFFIFFIFSYKHNFDLCNCRVPETMPLYDILNEFQKGHSHMAVVIRQRNDIEKPVAANPDEGNKL